MANKLTSLMVAVVLGGAVVGGTLTSCDDDDNNQVTGVGGTGGTSGGGTSGGGTGGSTNVTTFNMTLSASQEVPVNTSAATGNVQVMLNRTTGAVTVTGSFSGLTSNATAAHIHGPAAVGMTAPPLITLTVPSATSGPVTGNGTMTDVQMTDMLGGMTYVNIHSSTYPDGEIRAQVVP
jgi:hypothetical protein